MNKKADIHLAEVVRDLIIGAIVLLIILVPTVYLIKLYYTEQKCPNNDDFNEFKKIVLDIENLKLQEYEFSFYNEDCHITTFTQDDSFNEINQPQNKFSSPFICLCSIDSNIGKDDCIIENEESCIELKTLKLGDKQFTTDGLDIYTFLDIKKENDKLIISSSEVQPLQVQPTDQQIEPVSERDVSEVLNAMEYAKTHVIEKRTCDCKDRCEEYANYVIDYSKQYSPENDPLDPLLVVSIMMQESSCRNKGCRWDVSQYSCGMIQVNKNKFKGEDPTNPEVAIRVGIEHLKEKYDSYGEKTLLCYNHKTKWEKAAHAYNGWICRNLYYINEVMSRYDQLKNIPQPLIIAER